MLQNATRKRKPFNPATKKKLDVTESSIPKYLFVVFSKFPEKEHSRHK
jgi:hypothetical protein